MIDERESQETEGVLGVENMVSLVIDVLRLKCLFNDVSMYGIADTIDG